MVKNEINSQILTLAWSSLEKKKKDVKITKKNLAKKSSTEVCFLLSFRSRWQTRREILNVVTTVSIMVIIIISDSIIRMISNIIFIIIILNIIFIIFK